MLSQRLNSRWLHCSLGAGASLVAFLVDVAARRRESNASSGAIVKAVETEMLMTSAPAKRQVCRAKRAILMLAMIMKRKTTTLPLMLNVTEKSSSSVLSGKNQPLPSLRERQ